MVTFGGYLFFYAIYFPLFFGLGYQYIKYINLIIYISIVMLPTLLKKLTPIQGIYSIKDFLVNLFSQNNVSLLYLLAFLAILYGGSIWIAVKLYEGKEIS